MSAGGGYPPGSLILIGKLSFPSTCTVSDTCFAEEDADAVFCGLLVRAFVSSCLYAHRRVYTCGQGLSQECLPVRVESESGPAAESSARIAWRYKSLESVDNTLTSSKHSFDFALRMNDQILSDNQIPNQNLQSIVASDIVNGLPDQNDCCIVISGIDTANSFPMTKSQLIFRLKSLTRTRPNSVVLVTWNPQLVEPKVRREVHDMADAVFQLEAFAKASAAYPDFDGLFRVHKLAKLNSLSVAKKIETLDLGFQMKKHNRFIEIDKLCLPPDLSETVSRSTCSSAGSKSLHF